MPKIHISKREATILAAMLRPRDFASEHILTREKYFFTIAYVGSLRRKLAEHSEDKRYDVPLTAVEAIDETFEAHEKKRHQILKALTRDDRKTVKGWNNKPVEVTFKGDGDYTIHEHSIKTESGRWTYPTDVIASFDDLCEYLGFIHWIKD